MDFDTAERSASQNRPIDLYTLATPTAIYYQTSHPVDVAFGGVTYSALTMSRGSEMMAQDQTARELVIYLPITHPLIQRYAAFGIPEHEVVVTTKRLQEVAATVLQEWTGFGGGISIDGHVAMLRVPTLTDDALKIRLPVIAAQKRCNHVLYDVRCTVNREFASATAHITAISGNTVTTDSIGSGVLFVFGDIVHSATAQRRMVVAQASNVLTINAPFIGAVVGDAVLIAPGCDHSVQTCRDAFSNVINFGGHPQMNAAFNPWLPHGLGIIQQA